MPETCLGLSQPREVHMETRYVEMQGTGIPVPEMGVSEVCLSSLIRHMETRLNSTFFNVIDYYDINIVIVT